MTAIKGVRKSTRSQPAGIRVGRHVLPSQIVIAGLLSLLYVIFIVGGSYEGRDIIVQLVYFGLFGVMIFVLGARQRYYKKLGLGFLALAVPPMIWELIDYLGYWPASPDLSWIMFVGAGILLLGVGLTAAILFAEKGKLADIYAVAGNLKEGLRTGATALAMAAVLTAAYVIFHLSGIEMSRLAPAVGGMIVFAVLCAVAEELLFRGLLLSHLVPVTGDKAAFAVQAVAFAAYEAVFIYLLNPDPLYAVAVFVVAGITGAMLAWMTVKNKSLLPAIMSHTGIYLIIALPVFSAFF
jgi:membrane protease YdiL (CAAX protease family)